VLKGKYAYMSPEQAMGDPIDGRTDVFALAITLYEITTGTRLFKRKNELETLHAVIECEITPPSHVIADYDKELESIILKALAHAPEDRYQTAGELEVALQNYLVSKNYHARPGILADYLKLVRHKELVDPDSTLDTDVSINGLTEPADKTAVTQFAVAAARLLQEPTESPTPMSFDPAPLDGGTVKLEEQEAPLPEDPKKEPTMVVDRGLFQTSPSHDPEATVIKDIHGTAMRSQRPKAINKPIAVALLSLLLGLVFAGAGLYWKRAERAAPQIMSGPVIIESKPAGATVIFSGKGAHTWNKQYLDEKTPLIIEEGLPTNGNWNITLKKDGFEDVVISLPRLDPAPSPATVTIPLKIEYNVKNQGTVTFISEPSGAHIRIDGEDLLESTPLQAWPTSSDVKHEVEMVLPGFLPHYETFKVEADSHLSIRVILESEGARLDVTPATGSQSQQAHVTHGYLTVRSPIKMRVFIDGKLSGVTPLKRHFLKVGTHNIEMRNERNGLYALRETHIRPGGTSLISLSKKQGFLSINAKPWAKFKLGTQAFQETPHRRALYEGSYKIRFECPDGHTLQRKVTVKPGQTSPVVINCDTE